MMISWYAAVILLVHVYHETAIADESRSYYGVSVGALSQLEHGVKGNVYIVDSNRLRLRDFSYDGRGPAAFFWIGLKGSAAGSTPDRNGQKLPDENGRSERLNKYTNADIILTLPTSANKLKWISVWCERFAVNFGDVNFPSDVSIPAPVTIGQLSSTTYSLSSGNVTVLDTRTVKVDNLKFNGLESDVFFVVGNNTTPADKYVKLLNGDGTATSLGSSSSGASVTLTLPPSTPSSSSSISDYQFVGAHSYSSGNTVARVAVPQRLNVPPYVDLQTTAASKRTSGQG